MPFLPSGPLPPMVIQSRIRSEGIGRMSSKAGLPPRFFICLVTFEGTGRRADSGGVWWPIGGNVPQARPYINLMVFNRLQ